MKLLAGDDGAYGFWRLSCLSLETLRVVNPLLGYRHAVLGAYPFAFALMMVLCATRPTLITHGAVLGEITVMHAMAE